jgi:hypothetical protein
LVFSGVPLQRLKKKEVAAAAEPEAANPTSETRPSRLGVADGHGSDVAYFFSLGFLSFLRENPKNHRKFVYVSNLFKN